MIEKEASFLSRCCHLNLPLLHGINVEVKPFFIATQYYGNDKFEGTTLYNLLKKDPATLPPSEKWLHIITQTADALCHLHSKDVLHNDVKTDNIVIYNNPSGFMSPILIDFGKACLLSEAKVKSLSKEERSRYRMHHKHIAPVVVDAYTVKSDVYSFAIAICSVYSCCKIKPLKEVARHCIKPFHSRCTSSEILRILTCFEDCVEK